MSFASATAGALGLHIYRGFRVLEKPSIERVLSMVPALGIRVDKGKRRMLVFSLLCSLISISAPSDIREGIFPVCPQNGIIPWAV